MPRLQHLAWTQNPPLNEHEGSNPSFPAMRDSSMVEHVIDIVLHKTETAVFLLHREHDILGSNPSPAIN